MTGPKVTFSPVEEIIIHAHTKFTADRLVKRIMHHSTSGGMIPHIFWCEGYLLDYSVMDENEHLQRDRIEHGRWHIRNLFYAEMPIYTDKIALQYGGHLLVSDVSNEVNMLAVVHALQEMENAKKSD